MRDPIIFTTNVILQIATNDRFLFLPSNRKLFTEEWTVCDTLARFHSVAQFQQKHKIQLTIQNQAFVPVFAANILRHCPINLGNFALSVEACVQCPVLQGGVSQV